MASSLEAIILQDAYTPSLGFPRDTPDDFQINGTIKIGHPFDGCSKLDDVSGYIVLLEGNTCYIETKMENAQKAGAIGVILFPYSSGISHARYITNLGGKDINIGGVEISENYRDILVEGINISISPSPNVLSPYIDSKNWIIGTLLLGGINVYLFLFSVYRLYTYKNFKNFTLAKSTYVMLSIGAFIRIIFLLDFTGGRYIIGYAVRTIFLSLSFPFSIASTIFTGFYWMEIFSRKKLANKTMSLQHYKIHCIIVICIIFLVEVITSTLRASLVVKDNTIIVNIVMYIIIDILTFIFFAYNCHHLYVFSYSLGTRSKVLKRLLLLGVAQCVSLFIFIIIDISLLLPIFTNPLVSILMFFFIEAIVTMFCLIQSFMFKSAEITRTESTIFI
jgi:hypothetical protein